MKMHLLFAFLAPFTVFASSFNIRPFSEFASNAPNIVRGTITNVHTENTITNDGSKTVFTYANLDIKESIKGSINSKSIAIRHLGGTKDGITIEIPSSPDFKEGDDTVLFLSEPTEDRSYEVLGMELGKFAIVDQAGGPILKGGIFNYADHDPHDHDSHSQVENGDLSENQKVWSLADLRGLIKKQSTTQALATESPAAPPTELQAESQPQASPAPVELGESSKLSSDNTSSPRSSFWVYPLIGLLAGALYAWFRKKK